MDQTVFSADVARILNTGIETLRWCRQHVGERSVVERLQRHLVSVSALTLALNYEMDGELSVAMEVLERGDWQIGNDWNANYHGGE